MVCVLEEKRYVRSGDACVLCEGSSEATVYIAVCVLVILCIAAIAFLSWKGSSGNNGWSERLGAFGEKTQTKYKILVTFTQVSWNTKEMPHALRYVNQRKSLILLFIFTTFQILFKVGTVYPMQLPTIFTNLLGSLSFISFDISVLPLNCVFDTNFHDRCNLQPAMGFCLIFFIAGIYVI